MRVHFVCAPTYINTYVQEFGAVWLIVIANAFAGLLPAIVFGVILSSLIFAKQYSRAAVIKHQLTRKDFQSKMC
eukprot:COSAG06_NODE_31022_length_528_cov_0.832168_1_plen_73_part_10